MSNKYQNLKDLKRSAIFDIKNVEEHLTHLLEQRKEIALRILNNETKDFELKNLHDLYDYVNKVIKRVLIL